MIEFLVQEKKAGAHAKSQQEGEYKEQTNVEQSREGSDWEEMDILQAESDYEQFDTDQADPSGDILTPLAAKFATAKNIGAPLQAELSSSLQYMVTHPLEDSTIKEAGDRHPTPQNCDALDVPVVNSAIWDHLKPQTRVADTKLQKIQKLVAKGITAVARSMNELPTDHHSEEQNDALALLANAHYEINALRKGSIRPEINPKFAPLCKSKVHSSKFLFGADLSKQLKDMHDEQRATTDVVARRSVGYSQSSRQSYKYRPYPSVQGRPAYQQRQRTFLGEGSRQSTPWKRRSQAPHTVSRAPDQQRSRPKTWAGRQSR